MPKSKCTPLFLRLYEEKTKDACIIRGLESAVGHGAKILEVKRILFEYFSAVMKLKEIAHTKSNGEGQLQSEKQESTEPSIALPVKSSNVSSIEDDLKSETDNDMMKQNLKKLMSGW